MTDRDPHLLLDLYVELNERLADTEYDVYFDVSDVNKHQSEFTNTWFVVEQLRMPDDHRFFLVVSHRQRAYLDLFVYDPTNLEIVYNQVLGLSIV